MRKLKVKIKKKNFNYFWLILLLSFLPTFFLLKNPLLFHTHDGVVQLARQAAWFKLFQNGQFPPRWADGFNYGYGSAVLIFMYPWPYFLGSLFLSMGTSLVMAFKLVCFLSFWLSGLFLFGFAREFFQDEKKSLIASVLYQFASFRFAEIVTRGAYGEIWTYTFAPLVFWGLTKIFNKKYLSGFLLTSFSSALLILSHNSISLAFFAAILLFVIFVNRQRFGLIASGFSLAFGLALSAFYWLPALWERRFTYGDLFMKDTFKEHFPTLKQLLLPNFLNTVSGQVGDVPVGIGFFHVLALVMAVIFYFRMKKTSKEKRLLGFCLAITAVALFFMQPISYYFWSKIALLRQFQFSWRLLSLIVLASSLAGGVVYSRIFFLKGFPRLFIFLGLVVLVSVAYWRPISFDFVDEGDFWNYPLSSTHYGEADTIWLAHQPQQYPEKRVEVIGGEGEIVDFQKDFDQQKFTVKSKTEVSVLSHTQFFPGWRVFVNGQETEIQFQDQNHRGLITFRLPVGESKVVLKFGRTKDRFLAETISLVSFVVYLLVLFLRKRKILARLDGR